MVLLQCATSIITCSNIFIHSFFIYIYNIYYSKALLVWRAVFLFSFARAGKNSHHYLPTVAVILKVWTAFVHQLSNGFAPSSRTEKHGLIFTTLCNSRSFTFSKHDFEQCNSCFHSAHTLHQIMEIRAKNTTILHSVHTTFPLRKD